MKISDFRVKAAWRALGRKVEDSGKLKAIYNYIRDLEGQVLQLASELDQFKGRQLQKYDTVQNSWHAMNFSMLAWSEHGDDIKRVMVEYTVDYRAGFLTDEDAENGNTFVMMYSSNNVHESFVTEIRKILEGNDESSN